MSLVRDADAVTGALGAPIRAALSFCSEHPTANIVATISAPVDDRYCGAR
jgi:hypothetical protein